MQRAVRWLVILAVVGLGIWAITGPMAAYLKERNRVIYREAVVTQGKVVAVVNATGTIKPVQSVSVGSFVSGPILEIPKGVDFNSEVKKGQLLALVDPKIYKANQAREEANVKSANAAYKSALANLVTRKSEVEQAQARLQQAENDETRAKALAAENKNFISATEMDKFKYDRIALKAAVGVSQSLVEQAKAAVDQADAMVDQAKANLDQAKANVAYTEILSPVDGVIIDRKIDPGQTMAAQFQTPELFVVAPDLRKEVHVFASVDESDIGQIHEAQKAGQPVHFTVDAYPDELFDGKIFQVRMNSTTTQNVVTYPVVVSAPNSDLKLKPGMTASISFQLQEKDNVLRVPNAALRFYPQRDQVRPEDRPILENRGNNNPGEIDDQSGATPSADEKAETRRQRHRRHVWIVEGDFLRAIPIVTGLSNNSFTEVVSGELREGQKLVTGVQPKK